jgi:hypothetical protein
MAVGMGVALVVVVALNWHVVVQTLHAHPLLRAELAICGGALPGFLASQIDMEAWLRRRPSKLDQLLASAVSEPMPPAPGYTHYLPCALLGSANLATNQPERGPARTTGAWAGVLYVGPSGLQFRCSSANPDQDQGAGSIAAPPARFDIGPVRAVVARPVALVHPVLGRSTPLEPRYALEVLWPNGHAFFSVPSIGDTLPRFYRCLDTLRWDGDLSAPLPGGRSAVL